MDEGGSRAQRVSGLTVGVAPPLVVHMRVAPQVVWRPLDDGVRDALVAAAPVQRLVQQVLREVDALDAGERLVQTPLDLLLGAPRRVPAGNARTDAQACFHIGDARSFFDVDVKILHWTQWWKF